MARKNYTGYPGKGLWENDNFRNGMVYTDEALRRGMAKALVNTDISKTGGTLEVRDPFYSSAFKLPGHDLPKGLGKNTLLFKSVQEPNYEFFIDFEAEGSLKSDYKIIKADNIYVKDGDSFVDNNTGKEYRLLGIDTPEYGTEDWQDCKDFLQNLIDNSTYLMLIYDAAADSVRDKYDRDLVFVLGDYPKYIYQNKSIYDYEDLRYNLRVYGSLDEAPDADMVFIESYDLNYLGTTPPTSFDMEVVCRDGKMKVLQELPYQAPQWYEEKQPGLIRQDTGEGYVYWEIVLNNGVDHFKLKTQIVSDLNAGEYINYNKVILEETPGTILSGAEIHPNKIIMPKYKGVEGTVFEYDFQEIVENLHLLGKYDFVRLNKPIEWVEMPQLFIYRKSIKTSLNAYEEINKIKLPIISLENIRNRVDFSEVYEDLGTGINTPLSFEIVKTNYIKDVYNASYLATTPLQDIDGLACIASIKNKLTNMVIYEGLMTIKYYIPLKDNEVLYSDYTFKVETYKTKAFKVKYEDINTKYSLNLLDKELPKRQDFIGEVATENGYYSYEIPYIDILNKDNKPVLQAAENKEYTIRPYFVLPELDAIKNYDGYALKWEFYRQNDKYADYILFSVSEEADLPSEGSENTLYVIYNPTKVYKVWAGSAYITVTPDSPSKVYDWTPVFDITGQLANLKVEKMIDGADVKDCLMSIDVPYNTYEGRTLVEKTGSTIYSNIRILNRSFPLHIYDDLGFTNLKDAEKAFKEGDLNLVSRLQTLITNQNLFTKTSSTNYNYVKIAGYYQNEFNSYLEGAFDMVFLGQNPADTAIDSDYADLVVIEKDLEVDVFNNKDDTLRYYNVEEMLTYANWFTTGTEMVPYEFLLKTEDELRVVFREDFNKNFELKSLVETEEGLPEFLYKLNVIVKDFNGTSTTIGYSLFLITSHKLLNGGTWETTEYSLVFEYLPDVDVDATLDDIYCLLPENYHTDTTVALSELQDITQETRGDLYFKVYVAPYRVNETTKELETGFEMELNSRYLAKTLFVRSKEELEPQYTHGQNLNKCRGITSYKGQLVLYDNPNNPTTLYFSDVGNPSYFPLKKALDQFYSPIIHVEPVQQGLVVFTTNDIYLAYEVEKQIDEYSSEIIMVAEIIYSNLSIKPHNRNTVRSSGQDILFMAENSVLMLRPNPYVEDVRDVYLEDLSAGVKDILEDPREFIETRLKYYEETSNITLDTYTVEPYVIIKNKEYWLHLSVDFPDREPLMLILVYNREQKPFYWRIYDTRACSFPYQHMMFDPLEGFHVLTRNHKTYDNGVTLMLTEALNLMDFAEDYGTVFDIQTMRPVEGVFQYWSVTLPTIEEYRTDEMYQKVKQPIRGLIDTGYMDIATHLKKRFHKFYMELFNIDAFKIPLFLDFNIDGMKRQTSTKMELVQDGEGVLYYEKTLQVIDSAKMDLWELDTSLIERVKKFRISVGISGRGRNPQILLGFKTTGKFRLYKYGIVFKEQDAG